MKSDDTTNLRSVIDCRNVKYNFYCIYEKKLRFASKKMQGKNNEVFFLFVVLSSPVAAITICESEILVNATARIRLL